MVCRNQNLHISQTVGKMKVSMFKVCRNQNLHISQTYNATSSTFGRVCRNQNLHISQTISNGSFCSDMFVEIKIYISLKQFGMCHNF